MTQLIVNADDLGLTEGVNQAVAECHRAGSVSSATLVVGGGAATSASRLARDLPGLAVGLHFNLTLGRPSAPPSEIPSLVDTDGRFLSRGRLLIRGLLGTVRPLHVLVELEAQAARFAALDLEMTHVDSHQHVHLLPGVSGTVARWCASTRLALRIPWVWRGSGGDAPAGKRLRRFVLARRVSRVAAVVRRHRVRCNRAFASVFDVIKTPGQIDMATYRSLLRHVDRGPVELMVHPAVVDDELRKLTRVTDVSGAEHESLRTGDLGRLASELGYRMTTYREVG